MPRRRVKTATQTVTSQVWLFSTNIPRPPAAPCSYLSHPPSHSGHTGQMGCRRRRWRLNLQTSHNYTSSNFNTNSPVRYLRVYCFGCHVGLTLWDVADYVKNSFFFLRRRETKKNDTTNNKNAEKESSHLWPRCLLNSMCVCRGVLSAFEHTVNDPSCSFSVSKIWLI